MKHIYLKNLPFFKFCTYTLCTLLLFLGNVNLQAQSCECVNCDATVPPFSTSTFEFEAGGALNNDLSNPGQGVCGIEIDFIPDHIWSLEMTLTSPSGQSITLIGPQSFQIGVTGPLTWSIDFVPCGNPASPDPGFSDTWDNDQAWALGAIYTGSYYPNVGCLEDFNTGTVDGTWTLTVDNSHPLNIVQIEDFNVIFCDDQGLECFVCDADAGILNTTDDVIGCQGDSSLIIDVDPVYQGDAPDSTDYGYTYIIAQEDTIVGYDSIPSLMEFESGIYTVCGLSFALEDSTEFPTPNNTVTVSTLRANLLGLNPAFCGEVTDLCISVRVIRSESTYIQDTICIGDTLFFDTLAMDQTGIYQLDYLNEVNCDSSFIIDLVVQESINTTFRDTVCAEEAYFFNDIWLEESGNYFDTLQTTAGCDSFIALRFTRLDSILTNEEAIICRGDSFQIGTEYYFNPGIYTIILDAENGCDSTVFFDLMILDPIIDIAVVDTLNCNTPTVFLDASNSLGNALEWQWMDQTNGGSGIVSGANESILEVDLPGNYLLVITDTLGGNQCMDSLVIEVGENFLTPLISLTADTLKCSDASIQIETEAFSPVSEYDWSGPNTFMSNDSDPFVTTSGIYNVVVTGENGCTDNFSITIEADTIAPVILNAVVDDTLDCNILNVQLSGLASPAVVNYLWTGPGGFNFNIQNPMANMPGDYTLTIEGLNGCVSDTMITVYQDVEEPLVQIDLDTLGCAPDTIQLFSQTNISNADFEWYNGGGFSSFDQNPLITESGFYALEVTGPNGCSTTEIIEIVSDEEVPFITYILDTLGCSPDTITLQSFSSVVGSDFFWTGPGSFVSNINNPEVTQAGNYELTVTAPNDCETISQISVSENIEEPIATIQGDTLGCLPDTIILQSVSSINDSEFSWTGPNGFVSNISNPEATEPGMYNLQIVAPNGCETESSYEVLLDDEIPLVNILGGDTLNCFTDTLTLQGFSSIPESLFDWTGPLSFNSNISNPEITNSGLYELTVTSPNGCEGFNSIDIVADFEIPMVTILGDTLNCAPDTITLQSFSSVVGSDFFWTGPGGFVSNISNPEITQAGNYELTVTAPNGCETITQVEVLANEEVPIVSIINDTLGCSPDTIVLQSFSSVNASGFSWTGPGGFNSNISNPEVTQAGNYELTVIAPNGCEVITQVEVLANEEVPIVSIINDTLGCSPDTITLQSFSSVNASGFSWTGPGGFVSNISNPEVTQAGNYELTVTAPNGCETITQFEVLADEEVPIVSIINDTLGCSPDTIEIQSFSSVNASDFSWTGPGGFVSNISNPEVTQAGNYELTVTAPNGCETITQVEVLANEEVPIVSIINDTLGCSPDTITLQSFSSVVGSDFSWTGPGGFVSNISNPEVTQAGNYELTVTAPNGCETITQFEVLADEEVPIVSIINDTLGCSPDTIEIQSFSSVNASGFSWTGPGGFNSNISNPEVTQAGNYELTVTTPNGCETITQVEVVADEEVPIVSIINDTLGCSPDTITLQSFSSVVGSDFFWTGLGSFVSNINNPEVTQAGNYELTVTAPNGCETITQVEVLANEEVPIVSIINDTLGCSPDTITLQSFSSVVGSGFSWTGPGSFVSNINNPEVTQAGNYELTVTAPNGCETITQFEVLADEEVPIVSIINDTLGCSPDTIEIQSFSSVNASDFSWTGPGGFVSNISNPEVTQAGNYELTVTAPNGCETITQVEVLVNEEVPIVSIINDTLNCAPDTITLQSFSSVVGSDFFWTGPGSFVSNINNPEVTQAGNYELTATAPNGCETITQVEVLANEEVPIVSIINDTLGCSPDTITLQSFSSVVGSGFSWTGPGSFVSNISNPEVTQAGNYELTVTAPNGCETITQFEVLANEEVPIVSIINDTLGCSPDTIEIQSFSSVNASDFSWTGPGGFMSNISNPEVTQAGNYELTVTAPNGCETITQVEVLVNEEVPIVSIINDTLGCSPDTITLQSFSSVVGSDFSWTGPGGFVSNISNPEVTQAGNYELTVTAPNGCETITQFEVLADEEVPIVSIINDTLGCSPDTIEIQSFSSVNASGFSWTGPGGFNSNISNPEVTQAGNYELTVMAPNGCETITQVEVVADEEVPIVSIINDTLGCSPDTITLQSFSSVVGSDFFWTGLGSFVSNINNPEVTQAGNYELTVTAPNGCETITQVEVFADEEVPIVSIINDTLGCSPDTIEIQSFSSVVGSDFSWTGPGGFVSNISNPEVTQAGNYELTVTAPNGCETITQFEVLADEEVPIVSIINDTLGCSPDTIEIQSFSSVNASDFSWTGPGGFVSNISNPEVTQAGNYELTVTAPNGCETITQVEVLADEEVPIVSIIGDTLGCSPDSVTLQSFSSVVGSDFSWTGPGGFVSNISNPEVTQAGNYELTVTAPNGCETITQVEVFADEEVPIVSIINDTLGCSPDTIEIQSFSSVVGSDFSWTGPGGFVSNISNPEVTQAGNYELTVTAPNGCETITQFEVLADEEVPIVSIINDTLGCSPDTIEIQSFSSVNASDFSWTGPGGFVSNISNPEVTQAGNYELTVTAPNGCETITQVEVLADEEVPIVSIIGDTLGCSPDSVILLGGSDFINVNYNWTGPNSFTATTQDVIVVETGIYNLEISRLNGCSADNSFEVIADLEVPVVTAIGDTLDCSDNVLQLQGSTNVNDGIYFWEGPNSFESDEQNPIITDAGGYNLSVVGPNGCVGETSVIVLDLSNNVVAEAIVMDTLDCETTMLLINGNNSSSGNSISYTWLDFNNTEISNTQSINVDAAGIYTLVVNDSISTCFDTSTIEVIGDTIAPVALLSAVGAQSITCENASVLLSTDGSIPINNTSIEWFYNGGFFSNMPEVEIENAGEYIVLITNEINFCFDTDTILIEEYTNLPIVDILNPETINCEDTIVAIDASISSSGINFSHQWTSANNSGIISGQNDLLLNVNESGMYTLIIEDLINGCIDSASVLVEADQEYPIALANLNEDLDCFNQTVTIDGTGSSVGNIFEYQWNGGNIVSGNETLNPIVNQTGIYTLTVLNIQNACASETQIEVVGNDNFINGINVSTIHPNCFEEENGMIIIDSIVGGVMPYFYTIDSIFSDYNIFENLDAGVYNLTVMDSEGCEFDTTLTINQPIDINLDLGEDQVIRLGDSLYLEPLLNIPFDQVDTFYWTNEIVMPCIDCFDQWVMPFETTIYELTVINQNGCITKDDITFRVHKDRLVFIPNIFTPDDDGINDVFMIFGGQDVLRINEFKIFDRWGEILFQKKDIRPNDPLEGWDGTLKGEPLNPSVFVYFAEIEFIDGRIEIYKGDFTLVK